MDGTEGFCRGCLGRFNEPTELLQYTEKNRRLFVYSTGLQVKNSDTFTFQLCKNCYLNMKIACKFKKQCRTSDRRFKNYLASKGEDDNVDFYTFLKNDDAVTFRLPMSSTPAFHRTRDDDNESTCTSIRNFMTDMLQNDEIPDTEAGIIREIIEEEADVLEDSLDSHWLQDDMSIDMDLSLDFSFNPFSTPRSMNDDRCCTPQKLTDEIIHKIDQKQHNQDILKIKKFLEEKMEGSTKNKSEMNSKQIKVVPQEGNIFIGNTIQEESESDFVTNVQMKILEDPIGSTLLQDNNIQIDESVNQKCANNNKNHIEYLKNVNPTNTRCTIDRNLEKALKDETHNEFSLDNILAPPQDMSGAATPIINNILFGENLELRNDKPTYDTHKIDQCTDKFDDDININEFFKKDSSVKEELQGGETMVKIEVEINTEDYESETEISEINESRVIDEFLQPMKLEVKSEVDADTQSLNYEFFENIQTEDKTANAQEDNIKNAVDVKDTENKPNLPIDGKHFCITNFYCKMCNKKFVDLRALKIHFTKNHKMSINTPKNKQPKKESKICPYCTLMCSHENFPKHLKTHLVKQESAQCDLCKLWFTTKNKLIVHMAIHYLPKDQRRKNTKKDKKFVCTTCGKEISLWRNFKVHEQRHTKNYEFVCAVCQKGFFRKIDYEIHMRSHTGDRPFSCTFCTKTYPRRDSLNKHLQKHIVGKRYECKYCYARVLTRQDMKSHLARAQRCLQLRKELGCENEQYDVDEMLLTETELKMA